MVETMHTDVNKGQAAQVTLTGHWRAELFGPDGISKEVQEGSNTVTTAGKTGAAARIAATPALPTWGWMAVGTGSPTATLLGTEIARVAFDSNIEVTNVTTAIATFPAGTGTGTLTEAGTFDVVTANTIHMWTSATIAFTKGALDSLVITWTLTFN
jgi:hypothetical protein